MAGVSVTGIDPGDTLTLEVIPGDHDLARFKVVEPFTWGTSTIPAGFETDLESIPWFARAVFPRASRAIYASVAHDYRMSRVSKDGDLVRSGQIGEDQRLFQRYLAHRLFRDELAELRVRRWRRQIMWRAVVIADNELPFFKRLGWALFD